MTFLPRRDLFLALLVMLIWGAHFFVIKAVVHELDPLVALTIRFGITALIYVPFMGQVDRQTFLKIAEIGVFMGAVHQALLFVGLQKLDAASVSVLMQSQTIFALLLGWWLLKERFRWRTSLGLFISFIGLIVMLGVPDVANSPGGFMVTMASSLALSFSYIRMRQLPTVSPGTFIAIVNLASFPLAGLSSFVFSEKGSWAHVPDANWYVISAVLAYQVFVVSVSHFIWQRLLSRNEVAKVTCFTLLTPVIALSIAAAMGTHISMPLILGTVLILAGLGVVILRRVQKQQEAPIVMVE